MEKSIDEILVKVLSLEASAEDHIQFGKWLSEDENNPVEFNELKSYWTANVTFNHTLKIESSLDYLTKKVNHRDIHLKKRLIYGSTIAASVILLITVGLTFYLSGRSTLYEPLEYYTYLAGDSKTRFILEDGTKIHLNKHSKLTYSSDYNKEQRNIQLEGEAFFEVSPDKEKPFIVDLNDAAIKVLGTSFNVKTNKDQAVEVILTEGSIRFEAPDQQVLLTPDQQLVYLPAKNQIHISSVDINEKLIWLEGIVRYRLLSFRELMDKLEERFGVKIIIQNKKIRDASDSMSGSFTEEQSLEDIFKIIAITYPFEWEKNGKTYYIK